MGSNMKFIAFLARSAFFADLAPRKCSSSLDALGPGTWDISSLPCGWHMAKWGSACLPAHIPVVVAARLIRIYDSHLFFSFLLSSAPSFRGLWFTCFALLAGWLPLPSWHLLLVYYLSGTLWSPEQHTYIFAFIISNCLWPSVKMPHKTTRKWQNCKLKTKKKKNRKEKWAATNLFLMHEI